MSAALKLNLEDAKLSQKPPLGAKRPTLRLVWENPELTADRHKEKSEVKPNSSYGRVLYNYFRDYDPSIGRYIESDSIGLDGGLNTYAYVDSNPSTRIDPTGELWFLAPVFAGGGGAAAGGTAAAGGASWGTAILGGIGLGALMSIPGDTSQTQAGNRQAEYQRMKDRCDKKPQKTGDKCADLSREIDHYQNCAAWYEHWDGKWQPGRHATKIQNWRNRAENLKRKYDRECAGKACP